MSRAWLWTPERLARVKALIASGRSIPQAADVFAAETGFIVSARSLGRALEKRGVTVSDLRHAPSANPRWRDRRAA